LASELELDSAALKTADGVNVFAGNHLPKGASPLSMAYAGSSVWQLGTTIRRRSGRAFGRGH
jgi:uncharacterized protein YdiU (UPF0061 family)